MNIPQMVLSFRTALEDGKITNTYGQPLSIPYLKTGEYKINFDCPVYSFEQEAMWELIDDFSKRVFIAKNVNNSSPLGEKEKAAIEWINDHIVKPGHQIVDGYAIATDFCLIFYTYRPHIQAFVFDIFFCDDNGNWYVPEQCEIIRKFTARFSSALYGFVTRDIKVDIVQATDREFIKARNRLMNKAKMKAFPIVRTVSLSQVRAVITRKSETKDMEIQGLWKQCEHVRREHLRVRNGKLIYVAAYKAGSGTGRQKITKVTA